MTKTNTALSNVFETLHTPAPKSSFAISEPLPGLNPDINIDDDTNYAAANIRKLIEMGMGVVDDASYVAKESESPKAYEVVSTMIKNLSEMNLQLIDIHTKKKAHEGKNPTNTSSTVTNNTIFVGTTKSLSELISQENSKNLIIDEE